MVLLRDYAKRDTWFIDITGKERLSGSQSLSIIYSISRFVLVLQLVEKFLNCKSISRAPENSLKAQNLLQVLEHDTKC
jgi:hypothetical protein